MFMIDILGRRLLLMWGGVVMSVCAFIMASHTSLTMPLRTFRDAEGLKSIEIIFGRIDESFHAASASEVMP